MSTLAQRRSIDVQDLAVRAARSGDIEVIDVRTPVEFREVHCIYARNVPLDTLDPQAVMTGRSAPPEAPLYVICRTGGRAARACEAFLAAGYENVVTVEGGTQAWEAAGLPVERGPKAISLERQVRIAAGSLVLTGAVLGAFVSPWWIGLSAFVGAGLVLSGVTDTCGMAMVLAKAPWNQKPVKTVCTAPPAQNSGCCG